MYLILFLKAIKKYSPRPSIPSIKEKMNSDVFSFRNVTSKEILYEFNNFDNSSLTPSEDILFKTIQDNAKLKPIHHRRKVS